jgi:hypothetical protein
MVTGSGIGSARTYLAGKLAEKSGLVDRTAEGHSNVDDFKKLGEQHAGEISLSWLGYQREPGNRLLDAKLSHMLKHGLVLE